MFQEYHSRSRVNFVVKMVSLVQSISEIESNFHKILFLMIFFVFLGQPVAYDFVLLNYFNFVYLEHTNGWWVRKFFIFRHS